jgi:hypothetical protein
MVIWILLLAFLCAGEPPQETSPPPTQVDRASLQRALASLPTRPTVEEVQRAALRRATVSERTARRWIRRARAAAVLPTVTTQLDLRSDQAWELDQEAGAADALSSDMGTVTGMRLRAAWELDRLIFNLDELRAARAGLDLLSWRERLLIQVTQLYYERQRLLLEAALAPRVEDTETAVARQVRLGEVEAVLAGLTDLSLPRRQTRASRAPR